MSQFPAGRRIVPGGAVNDEKGIPVNYFMSSETGMSGRGTMSQGRDEDLLHCSSPRFDWAGVLRSEDAFAVLITTTYVLLVAPILYHHSMWRDELQAWLLARDSSTPVELLKNLKYEGHPGLWHLFLMPLTRFYDSPVAMQSLHLMIAASTCFLVARFAPFSRPVRALIPYGYFFFYEYSIISRNYALGVILVFLVCTLYPNRVTRLPWIAALLFLLAHSSAHGVIIALAIALGLAREYQVRRGEWGTGSQRVWFASFFVIGLGILSSVIQMSPPPDSGFAMGWYHALDMKRINFVSGALGEAFVPVPRPRLHFWGTNLASSIHPWFTPLLSPIAFVFALTLLRRAPIALFTYVVGTLGLSVFAYVKYYAGPRHAGFFFVLFLACLWMARHEHLRRSSSESSGIGHSLRAGATPGLFAVLAVQVLAASVAAFQDSRFPFSHSRSAATFLTQAGLDKAHIFGDPDYAVCTVTAYSRAKIFYVSGNRTGTFIRWDKARLGTVSPADVLREAREFSLAKRGDVIILTNYRIETSALEENGVVPLALFDNSITREDFYIYKVKKQPAMPG